MLQRRDDVATARQAILGRGVGCVGCAARALHRRKDDRCDGTRLVMNSDDGRGVLRAHGGGASGVASLTAETGEAGRGKTQRIGSTSAATYGDQSCGEGEAPNDERRPSRRGRSWAERRDARGARGRAPCRRRRRRGGGSTPRRGRRGDGGLDKHRRRRSSGREGARRTAAATEGAGGETAGPHRAEARSRAAEGYNKHDYKAGEHI